MRLAVTALAAVALLAAGCSTDTPPPVGPPPTTPPTSAPATSAPSTPEATPAPSASQGGSGGLPRCTTGELRGSLGPTDAGAGSVFTSVVLTNASDHVCELTGFPGVSYVTGSGGEQVGPAAEMEGARGGEVRLEVGGSAAAPLRMVNVQNFDAAACLPTPVLGLRIYPPGDTASLFIPNEGTGCAGTPPGPQLSVQTFAAA